MSGGSANGGLAQSGHSTVDVQLRGQLVSHQFRQRKVETTKQSDKGLELVAPALAEEATNNPLPG